VAGRRGESPRGTREGESKEGMVSARTKRDIKWYFDIFI